MSLPPLPPQPADAPWPTKRWAAGDLPAGLDRARLDAQLAYAFGPESLAAIGETHALVVVKGGRIVAERYDATHGAADTYPSWSMAKSITQALFGIVVGDGKLAVDEPVAAPEWDAPGDPRAAITVDQMLRMSSGLAFIEDYEPEHPSDVIAMLFGEGKDDVAHYAADKPLAHAPGTFWDYASGTTNILCRRLGRTIDAFGTDFEAFMRARLFEPIGMQSPIPKFDAAGTFIGSSYCFCTARDFARFGLLYLRDGVWDGRRILPEGWVDYARTWVSEDPDDASPYGAHWWGVAGDTRGTFRASGYEGQSITICPPLDLVVVRLGKTPLEREDNLTPWRAAMVEAFAAAD